MSVSRTFPGMFPKQVGAAGVSRLPKPSVRETPADLFPADGSRPRNRRPVVKVYREHNCDVVHRAYRAMAACIWRRSRILDDGPYATVSYCGGIEHRYRPPTVHLHPDVETAEDAKRWIDEMACGGGCVKQHEIVELVLPTRTDLPDPAGSPRPRGKPPLDEPCRHWLGDHFCDARPTRQYVPGWRCRDHTPAALAGREESAPFDRMETR